MLQRQSELEQFRLAGDSFYRLAIIHVDQLSKQGVCDPFVLNVGKTFYGEFLKQYFPRAEPQQTAPEPEQGSAGNEDPA